MIAIEDVYNHVQYEIATTKPTLDDDQGSRPPSGEAKTVYNRDQGGFVKPSGDEPGAQAQQFAQRQARPAMTSKDLRAIAARLAKEQQDG